MDKLQRVVRNFAISFAGQMLTWTSSLLLTICYGRFLGVTSFGELFFATTFVLLIGTPISSGYNIQVARRIAERPQDARRDFANVAVLQVVTWFVLYAAGMVIAWLLGYDLAVRELIAITGLTLLTSALASTFASFHYAFEHALYPVVGTVFEKALSLILGFLVLSMGLGVQTMACVLLIGSSVSLLWQSFWFLRMTAGRFELDFAFMKQMARGNVPFLLYGSLAMAYGRIDTVMLSLMANSTVIGWYGAAYRLFDTLNFLPGFMFTILYPVFSKLALESDDVLKRAGEKLVNFALITSLPIVVGTVVAAPNILSFLYGKPDFQHAVPALQALAIGLVFIYCNMAIGMVFLSSKRDRLIPVQAALALVFNVGLNLVLIPRFLEVGAAWVTTFTEVLLITYSIAAVPARLRPTASITIAIKALAASLVMGMVVWLLRDYNILVIVAVAAPEYVLMATALRVLPREDIDALLGAVRGRFTRRPRTGASAKLEAVTAPVRVAQSGG